MVLGLFPKLGALIAIMPSPVLEGAGIVMFGVVAASGISTGTIVALVLNIVLKEENSN